MGLGVEWSNDKKDGLPSHSKFDEMPSADILTEGLIADPHSVANRKYCSPQNPSELTCKSVSVIYCNNPLSVISESKVKMNPITMQQCDRLSDRSTTGQTCSCQPSRQFWSSLKPHNNRSKYAQIKSQVSIRHCNSSEGHLSCFNGQRGPRYIKLYSQLGVTCFTHLSSLAVTFVCISLLCFAALPANSVSCLPSKSHPGNTINNYKASGINEDLADNNIYSHQENDPHHRTRAWKSSLDKAHSDAIHSGEEDEAKWSQESLQMAPSLQPKDTPVAEKDICRTDNCINAIRNFNKINTDANPCDDFYGMVCKNWQMNHRIPHNVKSWSHFQQVFYDTKDLLIRKLNDQTLFKDRPIFQKLYDFFQGCKDKRQRNITGYAPLYSLIEELDGWPMINEHWNANGFHWEKVYTRLAKLNMFYFLRIDAMTDLMNTSKTIIKIGPPYKTRENIVNLGPFSVFRPEYYNKLDASQSAPATPKKMDPNLLKMYKETIKELKIHSQYKFTDLAKEEAHWEEKLNEIYLLQTKLEENTKDRFPIEAYRENYTDYLYNMSQVQQYLKLDLAKIVKDLFNENVASDSKQLIFVPDIEYIKQLGKFLSSTDKRIQSNYFLTNMVMTIAKHTTPKMVSLLVTDSEEPEVQENICFEATLTYLPELLDKFYLEFVAAWSPKWQSQVEMMVKLLHESFQQVLKDSKWMDEETAKRAMKKLDNMSMHVGFPAWYTNDTQFKLFAKLSEFTKIDKNNYFSSVVDVTQASQVLSLRDLSERLYSGTSSTLTSWPGHKKITDVNAFYYFSTNGVYIPAALLQPPFWFQEGVPKAVTFGSMGMIIGHEMTHAFDNTGRLYDYDGALRNWWSETTSKRFQSKAQCFVDQYSKYQEDSIAIDGVETLAENIADNGGVRKAYRAFKIYQERHKDEAMQRLPDDLTKFTPEQLFFISFANMWCAHEDQSEINVQSPHSPASIRVLGSLANFDEFAKAFNCTAESRMNPVNKCILW